jgi:hypothetical protein
MEDLLSLSEKKLLKFLLGLKIKKYSNKNKWRYKWLW